MATDRQVSYALTLLRQKGFGTRFMGAGHKPLATMNERRGTVEDWVRNKNTADASALIERLKAMPDAER